MPVFFHWSNQTEAHLHLDEHLLSLCEKTEIPFLRFWESQTPFVVLGKSNKAESEVHVALCKRDGIEILTRCSGGGTVMQGQGCLNYALVLPISFSSHLETITQTTNWIMSVHRKAIAGALTDVEVKGISDLTWKGKKFSGNAQRRLRNAILFHGTFLYNFDCKNLETYLKFPTRFPDYRNQKSHLDFVDNIPLSKETIYSLIQEEWKLNGLAS